MSRLVVATELIGLPVVTLAGDDVAEVRDVVYRPDHGGLVGFTLNKRGFFSGRLKQVLPVGSVLSIGRDAVMVAGDAALTEADDAPEPLAVATPDRNVIGGSVLTEEGKTLGTVTDVVISIGRAAEVVGYQLGGPMVTGERDGQRLFIPLPLQLAISGDALVVPASIDHYVRDDLTGFGGAVDEYRASHQAGVPGSAASGAAPPDARPADDGGHASKAELYEEARELDVAGRSSMTKAQLAAAVEAKKAKL